MIFITVGTQEPFDRLLGYVKFIANKYPDTDFFAQVLKSNIEAKNLKCVDFMKPSEFESLLDSAELIIAHAGMGSIISALAKGKQIIVVPRIAKLGEHRNDHQMDTAKQVERLGLVPVAYNEDQLSQFIDLHFSNLLPQPQTISQHAPLHMIKNIRTTILETKKTKR